MGTIKPPLEVLLLVEAISSMSRSARRLLSFAAVMIASQLAAAEAAVGDVTVTDVFGRTLNTVGITLVDWEGMIANPALKLRIAPPVGVTDGTASLTANGGRLYFDALGNGSSTSAAGPVKYVSFAAGSAVDAYLSVFGDRAGGDESYTLSISFQSAQGTSLTSLPVRVIDHDDPGPQAFGIPVDFSADASGFYLPDGALPAKRRAIVQQAADDWAYFLDDMQLDTVPAGNQQTWVWNFPNGYHEFGSNGHFVTNPVSYNGVLMVVHGLACQIPNPCPDAWYLRSGGQPQPGAAQTSGGVPLSPTLWRSAFIDTEVQGNYNTLGWFLTSGDEDWHQATNLVDSPADLYSIVHHEMGHGLAFNPSYPTFQRSGFISSARILAYHGGALATDQYDHFPGVIDRVSKQGIFGNEYNGQMPARRWLPTKLDLLLLEAVGYRLRGTSAFLPPAIMPTTLPGAAVGSPYSFTLVAQGGIPFYRWRVSAGALPPGLALDSFTGAIAGVPTLPGSFAFTAELCDYDSVNSPGTPCTSQAFTLAVQPSLTIGDTIVAEGDSGTLDAMFTVTLAPSSAQTVTVEFATADGSARAGSDYTAASGTLTFAPGVTSQTILVPVLGDIIYEGNEAYFVNLASPSNAAIVDGQGVGTITNDDPPPPPLAFFTLAPCRLIDTRNPAGPMGGPTLAAGADRVFTVVGNCNVPVTAKAVSVNVAVTGSTAAGNLRLYPAGTPLPFASAINYSAGQTRANNGIVPLDGAGQIAVRCAQASGTTHFILDVNGYFE